MLTGRQPTAGQTLPCAQPKCITSPGLCNPVCLLALLGGWGDEGTTPAKSKESQPPSKGSEKSATESCPGAAAIKQECLTRAQKACGMPGTASEPEGEDEPGPGRHVPCQKAGFAGQRCPERDFEHSSHWCFVHRNIKDKKEQGLHAKHAPL